MKHIRYTLIAQPFVLGSCEKELPAPEDTIHTSMLAFYAESQAPKRNKYNSMKRLIYLLLLVLSIISCSPSRPKIEVQDVQKECDFSIFHGLKPDLREDAFFSVLGQPNEWYDGKEDDDRHCPIYYFKDYKLKCYWDGEYPEIGVIEFIPYNNINYTIDQFLSNPQKYGIDANTKRFDIYSNGIWWFEVFLDNYKVEKIQYWLED